VCHVSVVKQPNTWITWKNLKRLGLKTIGRRYVSYEYSQFLLTDMKAEVGCNKGRINRYRLCYVSNVLNVVLVCIGWRNLT
jgi:hypothetical protein